MHTIIGQCIGSAHISRNCYQVFMAMTSLKNVPKPDVSSMQDIELQPESSRKDSELKELKFISVSYKCVYLFSLSANIIIGYSYLLGV